MVSSMAALLDEEGGKGLVFPPIRRCHDGFLWGS